MIKNIRLFPNDNLKSLNACKLIKDKFTSRGFIVCDDNYDLGIAVGGDGSFLRMIKSTGFSSDIYYVGVNTGTLGFLQELNIDEVDKFIDELEECKYQVEDIGIQESKIFFGNNFEEFYSLNEIVIRDRNLGILRMNISISDNLLENYIGDGILIATSTGSTAHNLSYGGSIVYNTFNSLQITPIGPINSTVYKTLINSVIIPDGREIKLIPSLDSKSLIVTVDGENRYFEDVLYVTTQIGKKRIKCLRLGHYNFPQKINKKMLND